MTKSLLTLLIVGLTTLISFGQESPTTESPPKAEPEALGPGDHTRTVLMGEQKRTYLIHVPKEHDPKKPAPVVLALHGAAMDGSMMVWFSGLNKKSEESGFIVVYPSGTGVGPFRTWNAGGFSGKMAEGKADDVAFIGKLLDDLNGFVKVDEKRVYACGMSNGGMMCYRLAAELFDRIAAIAPVAGTIAIEDSKPKRPVPVMHFHGTKDDLVPFEMADHPSSRRTAILAVHIVNRDFNCCYGILCPLRFDKRLDHHNLALLNRTDRTCHGRRCKQRVSSFHRAKNDRQRHMK